MATITIVPDSLTARRGLIFFAGHRARLRAWAGTPPTPHPTGRAAAPPRDHGRGAGLRANDARGAGAEGEEAMVCKSLQGKGIGGRHRSCPRHLMTVRVAVCAWAGSFHFGNLGG